jgi:CSLREA domain-containing protein
MTDCAETAHPITPGFVVAAVILILLTLGASGARAAIFAVNINDDATDANPGDGVCETAPGNGVCTLRAAIQEANALAGTHTVKLRAETYTLTIPGVLEQESVTGDLDLYGTVTIKGPATGTSTIDGGNLDRVFDVFPGSVLTIARAVIRGGKLDGDYGGCIKVNTGSSATLVNVELRENQVTGEIGGTAIFSEGTVSLFRSRVTANIGGGEGGALYNYGGTLTLSGCTVDDNEGSSYGGAILNYDPKGVGTVTVVNSTIDGNSASTEGGGIDNFGTFVGNNITVTGNSSNGVGGLAGRGPSTVISNSILAFNSAGSEGSPDCGYTITSSGHNIIRNPSGCEIAVVDGDKLEVDPGLGPLQSNGGPTPTRALLSGSPATDAGSRLPPGNSGACEPTDQRGVDRDVSVTEGPPICDIGAYERSFCGDKVLDSSAGEQCDAGIANGTVGSCCSGDCKIAPCCGDGKVDADLNEDCDEGAQINGTPSSCCNSDCTFKTPDVVCRAAVDACDRAETCTGTDGTCPADVKQPAGTVCRPAVGVCDHPETCDGTSNSCPPDTLKPSSTVCRPAAGVCDQAETCTGTSAACPADVKKTGVCRAANGACDVAESCDGSSNDCPPDHFAPASTVCRPAAGMCDQAETCTGTSAACPADVKKTGVCRAANGVCDVAESCDGSSNDCPPDHFAPASTVCRPAAGVCDQAETCTGTSAACPDDVFEPDTTICRAANGVCDVAERCSGTGADCPADQFAPSSTVCRPAAGECDVAEQCDGSSADCPPDGFASPATVCRPAAGECDAAETCSGNGADCPDDALQPAGTTCRPAQDACDQAELCDGTTVACPPDVSKQDGDACDDGDPTTTSVCEEHQCKAVKVHVDVPPPPPVPDGVSPADVTIHVDITVPDTPGPENASVTVQGMVRCADLPPALRPKKCEQSALTRVVYQTRMSSVFVPVTPRVRKQLGKRQNRNQGFDVKLNRRGRRAFALLGELPVQMTTTISDRQGETVSMVFDALLSRQH